LTTQGLLVLIGILSVARGVFLLFPRMQVHTTIFKLTLILCLGGVTYYAFYGGSTPPDAGEAPMPATRYAVVVLITLMGILMLPRGEGGVWNEQQKKTMLEYMDSIIIAGVTALVLIFYFIRSFYIPSESMLPTLQVNDMILVDEIVYRVYRPARGDIIVFHPPEKANSQGKDFIKRVIAVEGDTVKFENDKTYVNGKRIEEPYRYKEKAGYDTPRDFSPLTVPPGQVFCMGDNRGNSEDSRFWGTLPVENIIGKAFVIFFPFHRIGLLH